jgi:hypothetical protein
MIVVPEVEDGRAGMESAAGDGQGRQCAWVSAGIRVRASVARSAL